MDQWGRQHRAVSWLSCVFVSQWRVVELGLVVGPLRGSVASFCFFAAGLQAGQVNTPSTTILQEVAGWAPLCDVAPQSTSSRALALRSSTRQRLHNTNLNLDRRRTRRESLDVMQSDGELLFLTMEARSSRRCTSRASSMCWWSCWQQSSLRFFATAQYSQRALSCERQQKSLTGTLGESSDTLSVSSFSDHAGCILSLVGSTVVRHAQGQGSAVEVYVRSCWKKRNSQWQSAPQERHIQGQPFSE